MSEIIIFFKKNKGYARMKELKLAGFHTRKIKQLLDEGKVEKITAGLYRLAEVCSEGSYSQGFIDVCNSMSKGVICLLSALDYHQLSTINPSKVYVALPNKEKRSKIEYPPVEVFYFRDRFYDCGIEEIVTKTGTFKIYDAEKTLCDIFRYRNKLGDDLALEGLKNYLKRKDADLIKLQDYAVKCRVKSILFPYLKAMVIE
jgi:predicted transcriptional regulator of viral defense system